MSSCTWWGCFRALTRFFQRDCTQFVPAMSQPRRSERLAARRSEPVAIPLDSDPDSTVSVAVVCEICREGDPGIVHVPCCNFATHHHCVNDGVDTQCLYCSEDLRSLFESGDCQSVADICSGWFQRGCGLQWPSGFADLGCCVVCTDSMTSQNSITAPCCRQSLHVMCLARSFSFCVL